MDEVKKFYKYRSLRNADGSVNEFTAAILQKTEIWFAAPKDFNDPFDCNLRLHVNDSTDEEWVSYLSRMEEAYPEFKEPLQVAKSKRLWRQGDQFCNIGLKTWDETYNRSSVFCLSKKPNSIPMFSYYADNHKGVAIEFEFSDMGVPCGIPYQEALLRDPRTSTGVVFKDVKYSRGFPELNYLRLYDKTESHELVNSIIFTKHHEWAHEDEYRIFRKGVPPSIVSINKSLVTRVIFGCRSTEPDVDLVKGWLVGWPTDVVLARATECRDRFELEVVDFDCVKAN
ncbi:TPR domain-containing protein [Haloferula helveola]|uniref:TPR domain-containing protein n=1 Tax=Haloferula helveola TaxID=490095 RepID=A0ABM7RJP7_9BACT|nr:TPR domain-containing protein [Haloferula helveola]